MLFSRKKSESTRQTTRNKHAVPSLISSDMSILGNLVGEGVIDIDGNIEGNIKCHSVTVRKNGFIKGDLVAEEVFVYGRIQGLIKARNVQFMQGCHVEGVIMHESLTIEDGAFVDGRYKRTDKLILDDPLSDEKDKPSAGAVVAGAVTLSPTLTEMLEMEDGEIDSDDDVPDSKKERVFENLRLIGDA